MAIQMGLALSNISQIEQHLNFIYKAIRIRCKNYNLSYMYDDVCQMVLLSIYIKENNLGTHGNCKAFIRDETKDIKFYYVGIIDYEFTKLTIRNKDNKFIPGEYHYYNNHIEAKDNECKNTPEYNELINELYLSIEDLSIEEQTIAMYIFKLSDPKLIPELSKMKIHKYRTKILQHIKNKLLNKYTVEQIRSILY